MSITVNGATNTVTAASGLAIAGNTAVTGTLSATGITSVTDTTDATSTTAASLKTAGGLGVAKKLYVGSDANISGLVSVTGSLSTTGVLVAQLTGTKDTVGLYADCNIIVREDAGTVNRLSQLGMGYLGTYMPIALTCITTNSAGSTAAEFVVATRSVTTDTAPVERLRVGGTAVTLGTGVNLVMASGQGIDFSATANGSGTTTSEVLSDYEEGTWTPAVVSNAGTITTVGTCTGKYTKIGNQVTLFADIRITTNGTGSGYLRISGIPFSLGTTLYGAGGGVDIGVSSKLVAVGAVSATVLYANFYDNTYPGAEGFRVPMTFTYTV